jgi:hypothetical protein
VQTLGKSRMESVQTLGKSDSLEDWGSTNAELAAAPAVQPPASPVRKQSTVLADKQRKLSSAMQVKATAAKARLAEKKSRMSTWSAGVKDKVAKETGKVSHGMVAFLFAEGEGDDDDAPELARKNQALLARISQLENDLSCAEGLNVRATDALVVAHDVVVALQVLVQPPACLHTLTRPLPTPAHSRRLKWRRWETMPRASCPKACRAWRWRSSTRAGRCTRPRRSCRRRRSRRPGPRRTPPPARAWAWSTWCSGRWRGGAAGGGPAEAPGRCRLDRVQRGWDGTAEGRDNRRSQAHSAVLSRGTRRHRQPGTGQAHPAC